MNKDIFLALRHEPEKCPENYIKHIIDKAVIKATSNIKNASIMVSGGIDSSIVAYLSSKYTTLKAYTFGFDCKDRSFDETKEAKALTDWLGIEHEIIIIDKETYAENFIKSCQLLKELTADTGTALFYEVSKYIKTPVTLAGEGGDEAFGGYVHYGEMWKNHAIKLAKYLPFKKFREMRQAISITGDYHSAVKLLRVLRTNPSLAQEIGSSYRNVMKNLSFPQKVYYFDMMIGYKNTLLVYSILDRVTEVRTPLADKEVLLYGLALPNKLKYRNGVDRWILREAFKNDIPKHIVNNPKHGAFAPNEFMEYIIDKHLPKGNYGGYNKQQLLNVIALDVRGDYE